MSAVLSPLRLNVFTIKVALAYEAIPMTYVGPSWDIAQWSRIAMKVAFSNSLVI
jgi:hypothetical protein